MFLAVFFIAFQLFKPKSESLPSLFHLSLFFKEWQEGFTCVALYKIATLSESLPLLFAKEQQWADRYFPLSLRKKQAIRSKKLRADSQRFLYHTPLHLFYIRSAPIPYNTAQHLFENLI